MRGYLVFPSHRRYFDDLANTCGQLCNNYYNTESVPIFPEYVVTMKRGYLFENSMGEYGEFERGEQFLLFCGGCENTSEASFFNSCFPTEEICKECIWEGKPYRTRFVGIDDTLGDVLHRKMAGLDHDAAWAENDWIVLESLRHYLDCPEFRSKGLLADNGNL